MKKTLTIVGIIVAVLIVILIALPFVIDVNKFKPTIETNISDALGRKVKVGVALLPLIFSKRLEGSSFTVTDPQGSLLRSPSGVWNFSTMGAGGSKTKSKDASPPANFSVEKLKISNGTIVIGTTGGHAKTQTYQNVDLEASDLSYP